MRRVTALVSRLPIRVRVALGFAAAMAVLLTVAGGVLYAQIGATLTSATDRELRSRAGDVIALVRQADSGLARSGRSPLTEQGESFAQIVDLRGGIVDGSPALRRAPLLTAGERRRAAAGTIVVEHASSPLERDRVRLLATPTRAQGRELLVVVGASLEASRESQRRLGGLLLVGGPVALLIASLAGYAAAAGALRPVELMRRRAEQIRAGTPGRRLPVPRAGDELSRLGETLNAMLGRLEAAIEHERRFAADASHELRSPLAVLKAELELALREGRDAAQLRDAVVSAAEEAERLTRLAEGLLIVARADDGRLPIRVERVGVRELVDGVVARARRTADGRAGTIVADVAPGDLVMVADRLRLEQALGNMVDNALRHGGRFVEVTARAEGEHVALHVRDDGDGFPAELLPRAFDRFTRGDAARGRGGTGLGLAIVAAIAHAHGGKAHARNVSGGADVWLVMPRDGAAGRAT